MFGQAAAVLITLSTLLTPKIIWISLLAVALDEVLAFASPSHTRLAEANIFFIIHLIVLIILDGTFIPLRLTIHH